MCKHCYRQVKRDFYKSEGAHHKLVRISEFASNIGGLGLLSYNQQMRHRFNHKKSIFALNLWSIFLVQYMDIFVPKVLSSPRAECARAVTGRRCPHSGRGEDILSRQPDFFTETAVTSERKVEKSFPRWEINRHVEG